jgi:hypothetical protein
MQREAANSLDTLHAGALSSRSLRSYDRDKRECGDGIAGAQQPSPIKAPVSEVRDQTVDSTVKVAIRDYRLAQRAVSGHPMGASGKKPLGVHHTPRRRQESSACSGEMDQPIDWR